MTEVSCMNRQPSPGVSIVIPTLGRERVLLETVDSLLALQRRADEILIVDQTPMHERETTEALTKWHESGRIRWIRLESPSIPRAMNIGLREATAAVVLFVDDDIRPRGELVQAHSEAYALYDCEAVNGQVLQPGEYECEAVQDHRGSGIYADLAFRFNGVRAVEAIRSCIACNLSVRRKTAIEAGGFDERFVGAAYRFETEFCRRLARAGGVTRFEPRASVHHLRAGQGGTRQGGSHLTSAAATHSVGDYLFAFQESSGIERLGYIGRRLVREVSTRFHATHPWWIPAKLLGEVRGLRLAHKLVHQRT